MSAIFRSSLRLLYWEFDIRGCSSIKRYIKRIIQWDTRDDSRQVISIFLDCSFENEERCDKTREVKERHVAKREEAPLRRPDRFKKESLTFGMRTIGARAYPGSLSEITVRVYRAHMSLRACMQANTNTFLPWSGPR